MDSIKTGKYIPQTISKKQACDTGMAILLILLLTGLYAHNIIYTKIGVLVLLIDMTFPMFYYPFAFVWFGLSNILGTVTSKILLTVVYVIMVVPIGIFRRLLGKDALQLNEFKKSSESVLKTRNHTFTSEDIEHPF